MGDSKDLDFTEAEMRFEGRFLKNYGKKWDRIPTFHKFRVDRSRKTLINKEYEDGGGNYEQSDFNGPPDP